MKKIVILAYVFFSIQTYSATPMNLHYKDSKFFFNIPLNSEKFDFITLTRGSTTISKIKNTETEHLIVELQDIAHTDPKLPINCITWCADSACPQCNNRHSHFYLYKIPVIKNPNNYPVIIIDDETEGITEEKVG